MPDWDVQRKKYKKTLIINSGSISQERILRKESLRTYQQKKLN